jgi:polyhydroxyalkanoate synthesis regulator phasin
VAKKKDKDKQRSAGRAEAVRSAVDQAFQATADQGNKAAASAASATVGARGRAQELVDELAQAAGKVRVALDELRPTTADELRQLREDLRALERRVAAVEGKAKPKPKSKPKPRARRAGGSRAS